MMSHTKRSPVLKTPPTTTTRGLELEAKLETIQEEIERRRKLRSQLTVFRRPIATLGHFGAVVGGWVLAALPYVVASASLVWAILQSRPFLTPTLSAKLDTAIFSVQFVAWWFLLGVLQTIGFGSGLQSGVMFMLPHVLRTTVVADECGHLGFESLGDMWYSTDPSLFHCDNSFSPTSGGGGRGDNNGAAAAAAVTLCALVLRLLPSAVCFQVGATCGEVPPYFMSYTAAEAKRLNALVDTEDPHSKNGDGGGQAGGGGGGSGGGKNKADEDDDAWIDQLLDPNHTPQGFKAIPRPPAKTFADLSEEEDLLLGSGQGGGGGWGAAKAKMEGFIDRHGFWAIWALATFPSGAFDLCGVCCGQLRVPFRTFFGATLSGKALVRAPVQVIGLVLLAREATSTLLLAHASTVLQAVGVPRSWGVEDLLAKQLALFRTLAQGANSNPTGAAAAAAAAAGGGGGALSSTSKTSSVKVQVGAGIANFFSSATRVKKSPIGGAGEIAALAGAADERQESTDELVLGGDGDGGSGLASLLGVVWSAVVGVLMVFFVVSTVQEVARQRAGRQDEDAIVELRQSLGFQEHEFPQLHLSPALRSPKARLALRQPLFSPSSSTRGTPASSSFSPFSPSPSHQQYPSAGGTGEDKAKTTPGEADNNHHQSAGMKAGIQLDGGDNSGGGLGAAKGVGGGNARRRRAGARPVPEKLAMW